MADTQDSRSLLLPEGSRLVHIGPPKTGTTAVQSAFHAGRAALEKQGVHYAGSNRHSASAVLSATGRSSPATGSPPPPSRWRGLVRDVTRAGDRRVVISSEFFADAPPDAIERIVADLDPSRVHVVVTLRPLARIIPSQWQQYVQSGVRLSFDEWLDGVLVKTDGKVTPTFWHRHRHDELVARWAAVVGISNTTVIALDDRDQGMVLRVFEKLVGLTEGTLVAEQELVNRSMTLAEIEVVRAFNKQFRQAGLSTPLHTKIMNFGAASYMKTRRPDPDEARVETPQWALDRVAVIAREMVDTIVASGVRIVGDPEILAQVPVSRLVGDKQPEPVISPALAASAAMGVLLASGLAKGRDGRPALPSDAPDEPPADPDAFVPRPHLEPFEVVRASSEQLRAVLVWRALESVRGRVHAIRRRLR